MYILSDKLIIDPNYKWPASIKNTSLSGISLHYVIFHIYVGKFKHRLGRKGQQRKLVIFTVATYVILRIWKRSRKFRLKFDLPFHILNTLGQIYF